MIRSKFQPSDDPTQAGPNASRTRWILTTSLVLALTATSHAQAQQPYRLTDEAQAVKPVAYRPRCNCNHQTHCQQCQPSPYHYGPGQYAPGQPIPRDGRAPGAPGAAGQDAQRPDGLDGQRPDEGQQPDVDFGDLGSDTTAATSPVSVAPHMIGDFFGGGLFFSAFSYGATLPIAAGDRRYKISDNMSPIPQDRILFNYHHFHNAATGLEGEDININRFTFAFEKTFIDGLTSIEVRVPFANGLDSTQDINPPTNRGTQFGNIALIFKGIMWQNQETIISAGASVLLPTAADAELFDGDDLIARVENRAVHVSPFLGLFHAPNERLFFQGFAQLDLEASENRFEIFAAGQEGTHRVYQQDLLYLSGSAGYWLYRDPCSCGLTGIAPIVELHYTTALEDSVNVGSADFQVGNPFNRFDFLNLTAGMHFLYRDTTRFTVYGAAPLRDNADNLNFDAEFGAQIVRTW